MRWCGERGIDAAAARDHGATVAAAVAWYSHPALDATRGGPAPTRCGIFARIGLEDPFWDPQADTFGGPD